MLEVGSLHLRADIHAQFGGNPRAGICPTKSGPVLIFSDPASGTPFGYDQYDYLENGIYNYTGEGRGGDQVFLRGNKAIIENRPLLLFSRVDRKSWRFIGEVALADPAFSFAIAPDQAGNSRQVIVFRFRPLAANFELL